VRDKRDKREEEDITISTTSFWVQTQMHLVLQYPYEQVHHEAVIAKHGNVVRSPPTCIGHVHRVWETVKQVLNQPIVAALVHRQPQRSLQRGSQSAD